MYRRPKFLETLIKIRESMAEEADYDIDLLAEMIRSGRKSRKPKREDSVDLNAPVRVRARGKK